MDLVLHDQGGFGGVNCVCVHCRYNGGFFCWRGSRAVGFSANYAAGNGVPRAPQYRTLERVKTRRRSAGAAGRFKKNIRASGFNRDYDID